MLKSFGPECYLRGEKKKQYEIHKIPFVVGRCATADLVLASPQISRSHCRFSQSDQKMWLLECLSVNGLRVDGHKLEPGEKKVLPGESLITLVEDVHIIFFPQFQDSSNQSIEIVDVPKINTNTSLDEELKPKLALYEERLSKAIADLAREQRTAAENIKILQMRLGEEEKKVSEADLRNETLERRCKNLDQELKTITTLHVEELTKAQAETAIMTAKAADKEQDCEKRLREADKIVLGAQQFSEGQDLELKTVSDELFKSRVEVMEATIKSDVAAKEVQNLKQCLSKKESKLIDAEQRNKRLEIDILEAHSKLSKNTATTNNLTKELESAKKETAHALTELHEAKQRNNCLQLELAALQTVDGIKKVEIERLKTEWKAATAEAAEYKTSLHEKEVEIRNLGLEMVSVNAMSSSLSDDVAKYKRYWEESELKIFASSQKNAKLTKEIAALNEKTTKLPELTDKQLNDVKEAARLDQVHEFEEFIETDLQCAICFELVIAATALNCGHTFCSKCVRDWQARSANCPTCRVQIVTMQRCKMLDSFIARAAVKLSEDFRVRRSEATSGRGTDSQGQPQKKKKRRKSTTRGRQINFDLPGPEPVPEAQFFVDLT